MRNFQPLEVSLQTGTMGTKEQGRFWYQDVVVPQETRDVKPMLT